MATKKKTAATGERAVIVTTEHRGVFFGYLPPGAPTDGDTIKIYRARNCVYWSADCRGFMGLAANGPTAGCRVGPQCPGLEIRKITAVLDVSDAAAAAWEKQPWS